MKARDRCIIFLEQNGWKCDIDTPTEAYTSYNKEGYLGIDLGQDEIVLISDNGDFLHLPINYYSLVGALVEYRQVDFNYISVKGGKI